LSFKLAQFSDVHLGPMRLAYSFQDFKPKRLVGLGNWIFNRGRAHDNQIAEALRDDILAHSPNHIVCCGDLVNVGAPQEYALAAEFLQSFGRPENLSLALGNHDAYVPVAPETTTDLWRVWTRPDKRSDDDSQSPSVRLRRNIAVITLNSSLPVPIGKAYGLLGENQLRDLAHILDELRGKGFYRCINIHHPPIPGIATPRKELQDAEALQSIIQHHGAELVLYGHMHKNLEHMLGNTPVIGVASASCKGDAKHDAASWNLFHITRQNRVWNTEIYTRQWSALEQKFIDFNPPASSTT
jgi:3',5'-cyclic AMP phosphodiesterase CpdA